MFGREKLCKSLNASGIISVNHHDKDRIGSTSDGCADEERTKCADDGVAEVCGQTSCQRVTRPDRVAGLPAASILLAELRLCGLKAPHLTVLSGETNAQLCSKLKRCQSAEPSLRELRYFLIFLRTSTGMSPSIPSPDARKRAALSSRQSSSIASDPSFFRLWSFIESDGELSLPLYAISALPLADLKL